MEDFKQIIKNSKNRKEAIINLKWKVNARSYKKLNIQIEKQNIDVSHFDAKTYVRISKIITKVCPICNESFVTKTGKSEKQTCSYSCSNVYFRSGDKNPNWKHGSYESRKYRKICFQNHKKECVICGESKVLEVHHFDKNHENIDPKNLIPLCPTHHKYCHSKYKNEVIPKIKEYISEWCSR